MPRHRKAVARKNVFIHAVNRGVDRMTIFPEPSYYEEFLRLLLIGVNEGNVRLHAYTLLSNHFHLIISQILPYAISTFMKRVCGSFAQFFNAHRQRSGHLFQARYTPVLLPTPDAVLRTSWYVHQNPVHAKLVNSPEAWKYSSMREYAGLVKTGITTTSEIAKWVGGQENYMRFIREYDPSNPNSVKDFLVQGGLPE